MKAQVIPGNNVDVLKTFPDNHFDSIVTDPPYGIDFLGKAWDANTGSLETYQECLRVLKPGGHMIAFSAARTYHHLAVTIEQAGFEIRDQIMWIYSSGFPKSQDIGRQIHKKTQGRPDKQRFDPATMIREGEHYRHPDTGRRYRALPDINGDRLAVSHEGTSYGVVYEEIIEVDNEWSGWGTQLKPAHEPCVLARKPLAARNIRENCEQWGTGALNIDATRCEDDRFPANVIGEIPEYQKYFYCPKVSRAERHIGFDDLPKRLCGPGGDDFVQAQDHQRSNTNVGNNHPTVKPIELMKYLIRLVTPAGGHILDPFCGSGSTGCAAVELDYEFTGCELDPAYVAIAQRRIQAWYDHTHQNCFNDIFEVQL